MTEVMKVVKTKTFTYVLPMMGMKYAHINLKFNLVNAYLRDESYPQYNNHLFLLYKFSGNTAFVKFEETLTKIPEFVHKYDVDKYHFMVVYNIIEERQADFQLFLKSRYSQLSKDTKKDIIKYHSLYIEHPVIDVLMKTERGYQNLESELNRDLPDKNHVFVPRGNEVSSLLNLALETYTKGLEIQPAIKPPDEWKLIVNNKGETELNKK